MLVLNTLKFRQIKKLIECTNTSLALWLKMKRPKSVTFNYQLNTIVALDFPSPVQKPSWELNPQNHSRGLEVLKIAWGGLHKLLAPTIHNQPPKDNKAALFTLGGSAICCFANVKQIWQAFSLRQCSPGLAKYAESRHGRPPTTLECLRHSCGSNFTKRVEWWVNHPRINSRAWWLVK